jgi:hypothetical protein
VGGGATAPLLVGGMLAVSLCACTATLYPGPKRPDSETMLVESSGMKIWRIDNEAPPSASRFRLLPGWHQIEVALVDWNANPGVRRSDVTLAACFTGRPGHTYLVRPQYYLGRRWRPEIIDENVTYPIASNVCAPPATETVGQTAPYKGGGVGAPLTFPIVVR